MGAPHPHATREVVLVLRRGAASGATTAERFASQVRVVRAFADRFGLVVREVAPTRHDVVLAGTTAALGRAFGVELAHYAHRHGRYVAHEEPILVPAALHAILVAVLGLDGVPTRRRPALAAHAAPRPLSPRAVARLYRFPPGARGAGQRIAILTFGGGVHRADLTHYFARIVRVRAPHVRVRGVLGARNAPLERRRLRAIVDALQAGAHLDALAGRYGAAFARAMATIEATMDVEIAGAVAPGATIDVVCAPDTAYGYYAAVHAALGLLPDRGRPVARLPAAISVSWGASERMWTPGAVRAIDAALRTAAELGVTVTCASGDNGSRGTADDALRRAEVVFPASSPHVLACGGTTLRLDARGRLRAEVAWNQDEFGLRMATGGGLSGIFPVPAFQRAVPLPRARRGAVWRGPRRRPAEPGRGVPDVAASADPARGYLLCVGGARLSGGGTSAAAPLWAALVALLAERAGGSVGWLTPRLYEPWARRTLRPVARGTNRVDAAVPAFRAGPTWNACCGLGTPDGVGLLHALVGRRAGTDSAVGPTARTPATSPAAPPGRGQRRGRRAGARATGHARRAAGS